MAKLTYTVFTGQLVVTSDDGEDTIFAMCQSGFSNFPWDSQQKEKGKAGTKKHVRGGPIPEGKWKVHRPGTPHPDGGKVRSNWIPVGPVKGRTHIYFHPIGTRTEGCIAIRNNYDAIRRIIERDGGGWLNVIGGDIV